MFKVMFNVHMKLGTLALDARMRAASAERLHLSSHSMKPIPLFSATAIPYMYYNPQLDSIDKW